ncbi:GNAT family N-acetyltransferase [Gordonibacter massiliensis (ex Traore et al. 2017)]|uniref:N-acetyltransferase n=1 Tax=Gordonibacter massiliensis (ex Traore et al. 2017) TaxID=1841863 RepID=A0A842JC07_9ACTN|nr:N-acetyltransferase [Gordonibacter massiliensis (ex Traore et al. 2017)]MBC2889237.1 N-acetyltransferase [Gordonibacter massiliensis (ex Traore et al. 2017)]
MDIEIRRAGADDRAALEDVMREAFWNRYAPGCVEHFLLHVMRKSPAFVPELELVAARDGEVVGGSACMRATVEGDDGRVREVLSFGPVGVLPACQGAGAGAALIERTAEDARSLGFDAVLLCGDPAYYGRRGFVPAEGLRIRTSDDEYAAALQVRELREGALAGAAGRYVEDAAYDVDEAAAAAFDRAFPPKEKRAGTPSQLRFLELVSQRRKASGW